MASRFELEVLTRFRSVGLDQMAAQARRALTEIQNTPGLNAAQRATRAGQVRVEAARGIETTTQAELAAARSSLTGTNLAKAEAAIRSEGSKAQAALTRLFNNLTREFKSLGDAVTKSGLIIPRTAKDALKVAGVTDRPPTAIEDRAQRTLDQARERALAQESLVGNIGYQESRRREVEARTALKQQFARDPAILEAQAQGALAERIAADKKAARVAELRATREGVLGQELASVAAQRRTAERNLAAVLQREARQEVQASLNRGEGTFTQRLQARFQAPGSSRLPGEFQTLGQVIGSRGISTLGFAASGALLYGAVRSIGELLRASEELQKDLNQINAQLDSMGDPQSFGAARDGILSIARATGVTSDEVAKVFRQFRGAFDTKGINDGLGGTNEALKQTAAAMKIVQVTGLSLKEVIDSLTATAITFNVDISDIGDTAIGLQERLGVLANETITFVADLAPVAKQVGLSMQDLAAIGAVAQQVSGRSGAGLAENFARVLPTITNLKTEIVGLYNLPQLQSKRANVIELFAQGQSGAVFEQLIRDYNSLNKQQQGYLISLLGTRRDAAAVISVLENSSKVVKELDANQANLARDGGKLTSYFDDLQSTVANSTARLGEAFKQLGINLFESGVGDFLATAANSANFLAGTLAGLVQIVGALNGAIRGVPLVGTFLDPGKLLEIALLMVAVTKVVGLVTRAIGLKAAADEAEAITSGENAVANEAQAAASTHVFVNKNREATALGVAAAADTAEAGTSKASAVANAFQSGSIFTGGGASLAGISTAAKIGIPVAGAIAVGAAYTGKKADVSKAEDELIARLQQQSREELVNITKQHTDFWDRISIRFFGQDLPEELATSELVKRDASTPSTDISTLLAHNSDQLINSLRESGQFGDSGILGIINREIQSNDSNVTKKVAEILGGRKGTAGQITDATTAKAVADSSINPENLTRLIKAAKEDGDQFAGHILTLIDDYIQHRPDLKALLGTGLADDTHKAAVDQAGGQSKYNLMTAQQAKQLFDAGGISSGAYLKILKDVVKNNQDIANAAKTGQPLTAEEILAQAQSEKELRDALSSRAKATFDLQQAFATATLGPEDAAAAILQSKLLELGPDSGLTVEQKFAEVPAALQALRDNFQKTLDAIKDPVARYEAEKKGFVIPDEIRIAATAGQLQADEEFSGLIDILAQATNGNLNDLINQVATALLTTDASVKDTVLAIIEAKKAELHRIFGPQILSRGDYESYQQALSKLDAAANDIKASGSTGRPSVLGRVGTTAGQAGKDNSRAEQRSREQARIELQKAQAAGDPVRQAQLDLQLAGVSAKYAQTESESIQAEIQRVNAMNALHDAEIAIDQARLELYAAQIGRDPVRAAQAAIQIAEAAAANARGTAEQIRAQAQLAQAQNSLIAAQQDVTYAWLENLGSYYTTIGDSISAAETALRLARQKLADILADPASGDAERIRAKTAVQEADAGVTQAIINQTEEQIQTDLDLERATKDQAIARLLALRAIVISRVHTQQELDQIDKEIKSLRDQSGQDYQFNLPGDIALPTLYESRRLNQSSPGAYQDNRNIVINLTANNVGDLGTALDTIVATVNAPPRNGPRPGAY